MKTLRMIFNTADDDQWVLSLRYPKDDITAAEVETAMQTIVDNDVFVSGPVSIAGAEIVDRTVTELL
ncbi:MAG TPA: DUF2922 domain-containing protein [Thermosynergistes sp.]|nr:DUF2922 domain-containing protein [Thermosynergistes sp.]HPU78438.1 DUF2922 domain-containing protein [Thermosynergistes sp.]HPZ76369.1 DUF2922 domain-containing protein [Thermosynergistes sp.]HQE21336.1 DUF2922 domain-containing protein [Thermosynergistes sp.]HXK89723.1 DUF2922 domain-containing protein [Thermosynergistes sp.]